MRALICLPTYNEAENISEMLHQVRRLVPDADILVLDDASPDGTGKIAEQEATELGQIRVLHREKKDGLGAAYRDGFRMGLSEGYDIIVQMDCDFSHDPNDLQALIDAAATKTDVAIGSRYVPGGRIPDWPLPRRLISRCGNRYAKLMLGLKTNDSTAGFRAYKRHALEQIDLDAVAADGYGFQVEMAYRVLKNGGTFTEIPIEFRDRVKGTSKMSSRIVGEALVLVTWFGVRDRVRKLFRRA